MQTCGWKSKFLSDDINLVNIFLSHWVDDVSLNEEVLKVHYLYVTPIVLYSYATV